MAVARAIQYIYSVDDPSEAPDEAKDLIKELDRELKDISNDKDIKIPEAETRINAVLGRFRTLPQIINDDRNEDAPDAAGPTATPAPTSTATPQPTGSTGGAPAATETQSPLAPNPTPSGG